MIKFETKSNSSGFTLIETILVVALVGIISGIGLPLYGLMSGSNDLDVAENMLVASLRRAEVLSSSSDGDSVWGVAVMTGSFVLFKGASYASRDVALDEVYDISDSIQVSGITEVVFSKVSAIPNSSGSITLTSVGGENKQITINEKGTIDF